MSLNRRQWLKASAGLATLAVAGRGSAEQTSGVSAPVGAEFADLPPEPLRLWYPRPATQWVEALPLGNGRLGAMVWGGAKHERIQFNEDTFYAGGPYDSVPKGAQDVLAKVRDLLFAGRYAEAETLADAHLMGTPRKQMPYQPVGDLVLDFLEIAETNGNRRELDLRRALVSSQFEARGLQHRREAIISPVDQVFALRLSGDQPGRISLRVSLQTDQAIGDVLPDGDAGLLLQGRNSAAFGIEGKLRYALRLRLVPIGGRLQRRGERIDVQGADELLVLVAAATSYRRFDDVSGDPEAITQAHIEAAARRSWTQLLADHETAHQALFDRVSIDLGRSDPTLRDLPTDVRVARFGDSADPELAALYHQYGRYLLIASSRAGSQPANLQGIWNDLLTPPWESKYTININTQMNYWPAEANALAECIEPLERMIFDLADSGAKVAREMYGAPGWVVHHNTDLWRQAAPVDGAPWGMWPMGGVWLLQHLWDRWDYGRELDYLRRIYPLFRGAAEFFLASLVEDPNTGAMVTAPSLSPENRHPFGASLCAGPAMDAQLLRDLFDQVVEAARLLQTDAALSTALQAMRKRLPPHRVGEAGQLQEWQADWDMQAPERHHRHVSHLYALHPSSQINLRDTPELAAAAKRSLQLRGDNATGWGVGWRINLWARLRDGEHAFRVLRGLLSPSLTYPNLFDAHPPFQIDGNFGGCAGITEMLLQSWGGTVFLLPALPSAWPSGEVTGLRVRNAAQVSLRWRAGRLLEATLRSEHGGDYQLAYEDQTMSLTLRAGEAVRISHRDDRLVRA